MTPLATPVSQALISAPVYSSTFALVAKGEDKKLPGRVTTMFISFFNQERY